MNGERGWWNDERDDTLRRLVKEGVSASQIATQMGATSRRAIIGRAHRKGIPLRASAAPPPKPKTRDARQERWLRDAPILQEMYEAGASLDSIAARLGRPRFQVYDKARAMGLIKPRKERAVALVPIAKSPAPKPNWSPPAASAPRAEPTPLRAPQAAHDGRPVPFLDRRLGQCCWPLWEPPARTGLVCGAATGSVAASYCAAHRRQSMPRVAEAA